jgi:hypothetical protein
VWLSITLHADYLRSHKDLSGAIESTMTCPLSLIAVILLDRRRAGDKKVRQHEQTVEQFALIEGQLSFSFAIRDDADA